MTASPFKKTDPARHALYGKIEIARKQTGLTDDDTYRDLLEVRYGKRSRTQLSVAQLVDLIEHFKGLGFKPAPAKTPLKHRGGDRPRAAGKVQGKARALWLALYNLGVIDDPSERALAQFVKRQAGVDDLRWLGGAHGYKVIEALKAWAARDGGVSWEPYAVHASGRAEKRHNPRARVMEAQWKRLAELGVVRIAGIGALAQWVRKFIDSPCAISHTAIDGGQADLVIRALGAKIREAMGK